MRQVESELFDTDPVIRLLLEQIACAWLVTTNRLDLSQFQYDIEGQLFAVFFLNADQTIYAGSEHALTTSLHIRPGDSTIDHERDLAI
jgi:hypothetical protein